MDIEMSLDLSAFERELERARLTLEGIASEELEGMLTEATETARAHKAKGFDNVTGALRSSIGGNVFRGGFAVSDTFTQVTGTNRAGEPLLGGDTGVTTGRMYAMEQASRDADPSASLQLVLVAGMPYASELQNLKGRDVLESGRLLLLSKSRGIEERILSRLKQELKD